MLLRNIDIINLSDVITGVVESDNALSIKTVYRLNKNLRKMAELKEVIEKQKTDIIIKARDNGLITIESDGHIQIIPGRDNEVQDFVNDLNELYSIENELDLETFDIQDLGDIKLYGNNKMTI